MAANDLGIYRETTGTTPIAGGTAYTVLPLDTVVDEDAAYTRDVGAGQYIDANDDAVSLIIFGTQFTGSGYRTGRLQLVVDEGSGYSLVRGGVANLTFSNDSSLDRGRAFGVTMHEGSGSSGMARYQLQGRGQTSGEDATESADSTFMQLWRMPNSLPTCLLTKNVSQSVTTSWTDLNWLIETRVDPDFTIDSSSGLGQGIQVDETTRYLVLVNLVMRLDTDPSGSATNGVISRVRLSVNNSAVPDHSMFRQVHLEKVNPGSDANVLIFMPLDLTADDIVRVQVQQGNIGDPNDTLDVVGGSPIFAMVKIGTDADFFSIQKTSSDSSINGTTTDIPWDVNNEVDAGFSHSTVTNNTRVTLPTSKVLTFAKLACLWPSPGVPSCGFDSYWRQDGTTDLAYGAGGTGVNMGDAGPEPNQNQTDQALGLLINATGQYLETRIEEIGTGADTNFQVTGGAVAGSSLWWGLDLEGLPGDEVVILASDTLQFTEATIQARALVRLRNETLELTEGVPYFRGKVIQAAEDFEFTEAVPYYKGFVVQAADTLELTEGALHVETRSEFTQGWPAGVVAYGGGILGYVATEQS